MIGEFRYPHEDYDIEINNCETIIRSKKEYVTEDNQASYDFTYSTIVEYSESSEYGVKSRNVRITTKTGINTILIEIHKFLKHPNENYRYLNSNCAVRKIFKLVKENSLSIYLPIKLKNGKLVYLKMDS